MTSRLNKITTEEGIETFTGGPVWGFEHQAKDCEEAVEKIIKVVNILIEVKLFSRCIRFSIEKATYDLDKESVAKFIRKNIVEDDFFISMYGDTTIYLPVDIYPGPKRSVDMSHIISIHASYIPSMESSRITIFASSSIWLPFNCEGRPQVDVYALNLNRLSSALVKIEALGLKVEKDLYCRGKRCIDSGYLLENYASDYECHEHYELEDYIDDDDIYGVSRTYKF